jgi:hypothetical protein
MRYSQLVSAVVAGVLLLVGNVAVSAQQQPPIGGVTATVALEGTVEKTYEGLNTAVVKTVDGIEHIFHFTERTLVHGTTAAGDDVLRSLDQGSRVIVHYTAEGERQTAVEVDRVTGDGVKTTEGVVTHIDRRAKTMAIQLADGSQQTLRLTDRAAADAGREIDGAAAGTARVIVYVTDEAGRPVAHYFTRVS